MTSSIWIEDGVVFAGLIALVVLYSFGLGKQFLSGTNPDRGKRIVSRFQKYSILLLTYLFVVGTAHQINLIQGVRAIVLLGLGAVAGLGGLYALRRAMRSL